MKVNVQEQLYFVINNMNDKKLLRKIYSDRRSSVLLRNEKDKIINKRLLSSEKIKNADIILVYASFGSEISTSEIINQLLSEKKNIALPKCEDNGNMIFHLITDIKQTSKGKYGITEPHVSLPIPVCTEKTVALVPGIAFTLDGKRLGYGGGYYDRFLAQHPYIYTIGVTYEELIAPTLPSLPHDLPMHALATEERMVFCFAEK